MSDRATVDEVRRRVDIVELVGQYVPLRKAGANHVARCPFHDERTPSFSVNGDKGFYHCFGCKASGDVFTFYAQMEGVGFAEALRALAERSGVELPEIRDPERIAEDRRLRDLHERLHTVCEAAAVFYERCLTDAPSSELARGALDERGITAEITQRFRIGYAPAQWDALTDHLRTLKMSPADAETAGLLLPGRSGGYYDRFRHRLMFPILDRDGRVVAFSGRVLPVSEEIPEGIVPEDTGKYVNSPETPLYRKGELLFGLATARTAMRQRAEAILVEGNFDVVQMHQHGFTETVAPLGTSFTEAQAKVLRRFAETAVLVFDGDDAGRKAARNAHAVCARAGLVARVGVLPDRMDPDEFLRSENPAHGRDAMLQRVHHGPGIVEWLIQDAAASCGDNTPERVAAVRLLAPTIAAVRDPIERDVYVRRTAKELYLEEAQVKMALREHTQIAAQSARENPFEGEEIRRRMGLGATPEDPGDLSPEAQRRARASGLEALLLAPALLDTSDALELSQELDEAFAGIVTEARRQWADGQRLDGAVLLEMAPTEMARAWLGARLMAGGGEGVAAEVERHGAALRDALARLKRCKTLGLARVMKQQSAKAGTQGDPAAELGTLNEQLRLKRELARAGTKGGN